MIKKAISILALLIGFAFAIVVVCGDMETIPIHINIYGEIDDYGSKWTVVCLPVVSTLSYLLMSWFERKPQLYNLPTSHRKSRAEQEKIAVKLVEWLKVITTLMLIAIEVLMIVQVDLVLWIAITGIILTSYVCIKYIREMK